MRQVKEYKHQEFKPRIGLTDNSFSFVGKPKKTLATKGSKVNALEAKP